MHRNQTATFPQQLQAPGLVAAAYGGHSEHLHAFQQHLIEEQRQQLQKQQKLILELQENQRLSRAKEEAAQATAVTQPLNNSASQTREEKPKRESQSRGKNTAYLRYMSSIKQLDQSACVIPTQLETEFARPTSVMRAYLLFPSPVA